MPDLRDLPFKPRLDLINAMIRDIRQLLNEAGGEAFYPDIIGPVSRKHAVPYSQVKYALNVMRKEIEIEERDPILRLVKSDEQ